MKMFKVIIIVEKKQLSRTNIFMMCPYARMVNSSKKEYYCKLGDVHELHSVLVV